jgi:hypothetical protein
MPPGPPDTCGLGRAFYGLNLVIPIADWRKLVAVGSVFQPMRFSPHNPRIWSEAASATS